MNKWNRLVLALDEVFGFENKKKSSFRKVSQSFDEKTNEHVFLLEYRFQVGAGKQPVRKPVQQKAVQKKRVKRKQPERERQPEQSGYPLLQDVNDRIALPAVEWWLPGGKTSRRHSPNPDYPPIWQQWTTGG